MNRVYTDLIKFLCCILIFIHHFFLKSPLVALLGYIACSIFFFLSAYGVSKSLSKKKMSIYTFCEHRMLKIYKPLLLVNVLFISVTSLLCIGIYSIPIFDVFGTKITYVYKYGIGDLMEYVLGLRKIDSITWFLDVLLISYLLMWCVSRIRRTSLKNFLTISMYGLYLVGCVVFTPPHLLCSGYNWCMFGNVVCCE